LGDRNLERAPGRGRLSPPVAVEQLTGPAGELPPDLPPFPPHSGDGHVIVGSRLVPHPGDHGGFGPMFDRDSLRPGHGPTSDRGCVIGDSTGQAVGKIGVIRMKGQELDHRPQEVFDVIGLGVFTAFGIGIFPLCVALGGSLGI
jgi:hypothetical protein